jgi:hypothetical protein
LLNFLPVRDGTMRRYQSQCRFCRFPPIPIVAEIVTGYAPDVPAAAVPESRPAVGLNVTLDGSEPDVIASVGAGVPVAVTVMPLFSPTGIVMALTEVNAGAIPIVSVAALVVESGGKTPLVNTARYWLPLSVSVAVKL